MHRLYVGRPSSIRRTRRFDDAPRLSAASYAFSMPPYVTDWISSIASLVGGLAGVGALIVAILSYLKSSRALAAEKDSLDSMSATIAAVEALGAISATAGPHQSAAQSQASRVDGEDAFQEDRDQYEAALEKAQDKLATARSRVFTVTCPHCGGRLGPFKLVRGGMMECGRCGNAFTLRP